MRSCFMTFAAYCLLLLLLLAGYSDVSRGMEREKQDPVHYLQVKNGTKLERIAIDSGIIKHSATLSDMFKDTQSHIENNEVIIPLEDILSANEVQCLLPLLSLIQSSSDKLKNEISCLSLQEHALCIKAANCLAITKILNATIEGFALKLIGHLEDFKTDRNFITKFCFSPEINIAIAKKVIELTEWPKQLFQRFATIKNTQLVEWKETAFLALNSNNIFHNGAVVGSFADFLVCFWDLKTGQPIAKPLELTGQLEVHDLSYDGAYFAVVYKDELTASVFNVKSGKVLTELKGHTAPIVSLCFSHDGTRIATGSTDKTVRLWNSQNGQCLATLNGHTGPIALVAFNPDDKIIITSAADKTTRFWNVNTNLCAYTLNIASIAAFCFGDLVALYQDNCQVCVFNVQNNSSLLTLKAEDYNLSASNHFKKSIKEGSGFKYILYTLGGAAAAYGIHRFLNFNFNETERAEMTAGLALFMGALITSKFQNDLTGAYKSINMNFNADGIFAISLLMKTELISSTVTQIWDPKNAKHEPVFTVENEALVSFNADGSLFATCSNPTAKDSFACIRETKTGKLLASLTQINGLRPVYFLKDELKGEKLVTLNGSNILQLWTLRPIKLDNYLNNHLTIEQALLLVACLAPQTFTKSNLSFSGHFKEIYDSLNSRFRNLLGELLKK